MADNDAHADIEALYQELGPGLTRYLRRLLQHSGGMAEDIAQEAFLILVRRWPDVRDHPNLKAWLYKVARRLAIDTLQERSRGFLQEEPPDQAGVAGDDPSDRYNESLSVREAIGKLPPRQREAVWLSYYYDFKQNEIATIMQIQRGTAAALLSQARSRLAETLGSPGEEGSVPLPPPPPARTRPSPPLSSPGVAGPAADSRKHGQDDDGSAGGTLNLGDDDGSARVYVRGRMEPELVVDQPSTVEVLVAGEPIHHVERPTDRGGQAPVMAGQPLLVEVAGRVNLEVTGRDRVEIPVPARGEPRLLLFDVRATHQGDGELWVIVRQGPLPLLTLVLRPSIHQPPPGVAEARLEATGQALVGPSPAPLTVLRVFEQRHGEAIIYLYELDAPELGFTHAYASRPIEQDRDAYVRGLFARIEQVWRDSDEDIAAFQEQLRAFGGQLLDELVPLELQRDLWDLRDRLAHIVVLSTEPFIPWELVHLKDPGAGRLPAETCFLAQLGLVRWLWQPQTSGRYGNVRLPERLRVRPGRARYVIPEYPDPAWQLPAAAAEREFLEQYLDAGLVTPHHAEVLALLRDPSGPEGFDLLHFGGHGQAASDDIADAQLLLEGRMERGQYRSEPLRVTVAAQNFRVTSQPGPIVVLNACQAGRLGHQLASIGGFAQAFLGGGASAFISSLWSVGDAPAGVFVQVLYRRLLRGASMAEAVKRAREVARRSGDATWLAYTVYAHPGARLQREVDVAPGSVSSGQAN